MLGNASACQWPTFHIPHCSSTMATESNSSEVKRTHDHAGMHCIAPGCTNYFYNKKKGIHSHSLPVGKQDPAKEMVAKPEACGGPSAFTFAYLQKAFLARWLCFSLGVLTDQVNI